MNSNALSILSSLNSPNAYVAEFDEAGRLVAANSPEVLGDVLGGSAALDAAGDGLAVESGTGDESLTFTPTSANGGRLTRTNSSQVLNLSGVTGDVAINPKGGDDEVTIVGTTGADSILGIVDLLTQRPAASAALSALAVPIVGRPGWP